MSKIRSTPHGSRLISGALFGQVSPSWDQNPEGQQPLVGPTTPAPSALEGLQQLWPA